MGANYAWVNATKMEHLGNMPFRYGVKMLENCRFPNDRTDVALTLLADRWHGDLVAYVSDYTVLADCEGKGLAQMAEYFPENPRDYVEDHKRFPRICELPWQKNWGDLPEIGWFSSTWERDVGRGASARKP